MMRSHSKKQSGAVLVLVLWVLGILSLLLATFLSGSRIESSISADAVARVKLRSAVEGVAAWMAVYRSQDESGFDDLQGTAREARFLQFRMPDIIQILIVWKPKFSLFGKLRVFFKSARFDLPQDCEKKRAREGGEINE